MKLALAITNDNNSILGNVELIEINGQKAYEIYKIEENDEYISRFASVLVKYIKWVKSNFGHTNSISEINRLIDIHTEHVGDYNLRWYIEE